MARTAWYWSTILVLIAAVAVGACPQACAGEQEDVTYRVVDTGQSTCYGDSSIITCPRKGASFYGQDAQHAGNPPQYVDNGDGTVSYTIPGPTFYGPDEYTYTVTDGTNETVAKIRIDVVP